MSRISQHQRHRCNIETSSVEEYFKQTIAIPLLDQLISDISQIFSEHSKQSATLEALLPINITSANAISDISSAVTFYAEDLPNSDILDEELHRWKLRWLSCPLEKRPNTLSGSLKQYSYDTLPNEFTLLKVFATIPLSSCSCERSASTLRRLNTYLRCTQTEERLSALVLIHTHYESDINIMFVKNI